MTPARLATPADEDSLMDLCHMLHAENGTRAMNEDRVRGMVRRCLAQDRAIIGERAVSSFHDAGGGQRDLDLQQKAGCLFHDVGPTLQIDVSGGIVGRQPRYLGRSRGR